MSSESAKSSTRSRPLRRVAKFLLPVVAVPLVLALAWSALVFVDEGEYAIVERFGEIVAVYDRPADRGLQFKLPWPIDVVRKFDRRVQLYEPPGREVFTADKKNLTVAVYVCWRIAPPREEAGELGDRPVVRFFRNLASPAVAEARLDSRVRSSLSTELGRIQLGELLAASSPHSGPGTDKRGRLSQIAADVRKRLQESRDGKTALTEELGIEIVDLRIRRINFPVGNRQAVYDRMRSERKKEADQYRAAGTSENKAIRSRADLQYERVLSHARADAERIRGNAEAKAIAIRNAAHAKDPEFYVTLRTLQTYKKILNEKTTLVLSASSSLLKMLTEGIPGKTPPSPGRGKDVKTTTGSDAPTRPFSRDSESSERSAP